MIPPIRGLSIAVVFTLVVAYLAVSFFGGYQYSNHIAMNGTLASTYNSIIANSTAPGGIFSFGGLLTTSNNFGTKFQNVTGFFAAVNAATSALSFIVGFITLLPNMVYGMIQFIAQPFVALGLPVGFVIVGLTILLTILILLAIGSGVLIFPMIFFDDKMNNIDDRNNKNAMDRNINISEESSDIL